MAKRAVKRTKEEQRSYTMRRIKSKDTGIEVLLRKALWHEGIRYRKNYKALAGTPDIAIQKYKIAIFCDGEFWHGKDWSQEKKRVHTNKQYWVDKIERNMGRDTKVEDQLYRRGWHVMRFWGNEITKSLDDCVWEVKEQIIQAQMDMQNFSHGGKP